MFWNRKDEDDEYQRYMEECEEREQNIIEAGDSEIDNPEDTRIKYTKHTEYKNDSKLKGPAKRFADFLDEGETVLWTQKAISKSNIKANVFFIIMMLVCAYYLVKGCIEDGFTFKSFLLLIVGWIFYFCITDSPSHYAATDKRVIELVGTYQVTSYYYSSITDLTMKDNGKGKGSITFEVISTNSPGTITIKGIKHPKVIYDIINSRI